MSRVLRTMQVRATATMHKCTNCGKVISFGKRMMIAVMTTPGQIYNDYYCMKCARQCKDIFEEVE